MTVFDDLGSEQERLAGILGGLDEAQWMSPSVAAGWTVADVVLHLGQSCEALLAVLTRTELRTGLGAVTADGVDARAAQAVLAERAGPSEVFGRWQRARAAAMTALAAADPGQPIPWVTGPAKVGTIATTILTEHWAHGLDITGPLGIDFPDTERLRHVAWLAHRMLPYALSLGGVPPADVRCELTAPDAEQVWPFGPAEAASSITGPAGDFCRVAVRRLDPAGSALRADGPDGAAALRLLRTYAQ